MRTLEPKGGQGKVVKPEHATRRVPNLFLLFTRWRSYLALNLSSKQEK